MSKDKIKEDKDTEPKDVEAKKVITQETKEEAFFHTKQVLHRRRGIAETFASREIKRMLDDAENAKQATSER